MSTTGCFPTDSHQNFTAKKGTSEFTQNSSEDCRKVFRWKTQTQIKITVFLIGPQLADFSGSSSDIGELVSNNKKAPILLYIQYIQITCKKLHNLYITVSEFCDCFRPITANIQTPFSLQFLALAGISSFMFFILQYLLKLFKRFVCVNGE